MKQNQSNRKSVIQICIITLSILGLMVCIAVLFPQVNQMILNLIEQFIQRDLYWRHVWLQVLPLIAMNGICFILFFDFCTLTNFGRTLVQQVKQEIIDCLTAINYRSFLIPILLLSVVYLLGMLTIMRANFLYLDDIWRSASGLRQFYNWSRYVSEFTAIFVHADTNLTDISPLPQLLAILILSVSSVLLVYVMGESKTVAIKLLASIPLGLSPFFLECLSYKFDAPYMALSILASIIPFLFITRKKAFLVCSVVSLLIMYMTYQAASGIYPMIVIILCFQDWNSRKKSNKEILSFMGVAALAFCCAGLIFRFFLMMPPSEHGDYIVSTVHPLSHILSGTLVNIKEYAMNINHDLGTIWKICITFVLLFFITKSMYKTAQKKLASFCISMLVVVIAFVLSFGLYSLMERPMFQPRALYGFGVFIAIFCVYVVSDYKKIANVMVFSLNWCFLVFAFSYGNALADQARYGEFRIGILLHDLSSLYPDQSKEGIQIQLENSIDYTPSVKNISKHYPIIERLVPKRLGTDFYLDDFYFLLYNQYKTNGKNKLTDFNTLNLPVVVDSYYHTIKSDGSCVLVILKH